MMETSSNKHLVYDKHNDNEAGKADKVQDMKNLGNRKYFHCGGEKHNQTRLLIKYERALPLMKLLFSLSPFEGRD
jgi:hypothetical protein